MTAPEKITCWPKRTFPLNLRRGAIVTFDQTFFILGEDLMETPGPYDGNWYVIAVGEFEIYGIKYLRFYLENNQDEGAILQITDSESPEACFMKIPYSFSFETKEAIDEWLNDKTGLMGDRVLGSPQGNTITRVFNSEGDDHIKPLAFTETIFTDDSVIEVENESMVFSREIIFPDDAGSVIETFIPSIQTDEEGALLQIYVGINMPLPAIKVI